MPALFYHLQHMSHRDLRAVATRLSLRQSGSHNKQAWIEVLHHFLLSKEAVTSLGSLLSPSALNALSRLIAAGELPAPLFFAEYGPIRRPGVNRAYNPSPWQSPQSVSEELYYTGLLHSADGRKVDRCRALTVPVDLRPILQQQVTEQRISSARPFPLLHDLAQCLLYLHAEDDLRLLHGRWLPASHLARLNQRLLLPEEATLPTSHKRCHRLAFLFFLVEAAGLLVNGALTAFCWSWLREPPAQQLTLLWQAWLSAEPALRQRYAQPGAYLPTPWPHLLVKQLAAWQGALTPADLSMRILADSPAYEGFFLAWMDTLSDLDRLLAETLYHPLRYLALIATPETLPPGSETAFAPSLPFRLTSVGLWLLQPTHFPPAPELDQWPTQPTAQLTVSASSDQGWLLSVRVTAPPAPLLGLAPYTRYLALERTQSVPTHRLALEPSRLAQAAAQGSELFPLLQTLAELGVTLSAQEKAVLADWHQAGRALQVQLLPLLRARSVVEMQELHAHPASRRMIGELLTPTLALLADEPAAAMDKLAEAGFFIRSFLPPSSPAQAAPQPEGPEGSAGPATPEPAAVDPATIWLMGQVYALLAKQIPLPDPPYRQLALLFSQLPSLQQATLQAQLTRAQTDLNDLLDGIVFAPPPRPSDPQAWLPLIEEALDNGSDLDMTYFTAGRNLLTQRRVQPYWVTHTGHTFQLTAYCHSAGEMRTFNLDRIQSLAIANRDS